MNDSMLSASATPTCVLSLARSELRKVEENVFYVGSKKMQEEEKIRARYAVT